MNILNNLSFGTPQKSGIMTVIPLTGDNVAEKVTSVLNTRFVNTDDYGSMTFNNQTNLYSILPSGYTILTEQEAQDHALPFAALVKPNSFQTFENACCVEQTQPGFIDGSKIKDFHLLPLEVRKQHFKKFVLNQKISPYEIDYSRLWDIILDFQGKLVQKNSAHLSYFFNAYLQELNQFNAEFEVIKNQRGAIILMNDTIVGIEIMPTQEDWKVVWKKLIRDCYGSEILRLTKLNLVRNFEDSLENKLDLSSCQTIEDIENLLIEKETNTIEKIKTMVSELLSKQKTEHSHYNTLKLEKNNTDKIKYSLLSSNGGNTLFEIFQTDNEILYASILSS